MPHFEGPAKAISAQRPDAATYVILETAAFTTGYITVTSTPQLAFYIKNNSTDRFYSLGDLIMNLNPISVSNINPVIDFQVIFGGTVPTANITTSGFIATKAGLISNIPMTLYLWDGVGSGMTGSTGNINGGQLTVSEASATYSWGGQTSIAPGGTFGVNLVKRPGTPDVTFSLVILGIWI